MDNPFLRCRRASCSGPGLTTSFPHFPRRADRPICRPAAAPINGVSAAAGRRGLGAGPRPPSAAGSEMRKTEFMPPASPEGHRTRNQVLTFPIEIAELTAHYSAATRELFKELPEQRIAENTNFLAAIDKGLHVHAKNPFQVKELVPTHGLAADANLRLKRLRQHEESPGEALRRPLAVDILGNIENHTAEFMRYRKALPFTPPRVRGSQQ